MQNSPFPVAIFVLVAVAACVALNTDEDAAQTYLDGYNIEQLEASRKLYILYWNYKTNLTEYNNQKVIAASKIAGARSKKVSEAAKSFDYKNFKDEKLKRVFGWLADAGMGILTSAEQTEFTRIENTMSSLYSNASVCRKIEKKECLSLTDLSEIMRSSDDYWEKDWAWTGFRAESGKRIRPFYPRYVELKNKAAKENGYKDAAEWQVSSYEWPKIIEDSEKLWQTIKPLYQQIHAYVGRKMRAHYNLTEGKHIDAHILGDMWAQDWSSVYEIVRPYDAKSVPNLDEKLKEQNYTSLGMVRKAEEFFVGLGLQKLPKSFWKLSLFEQPEDRQVVCHASAWDMYNNKDVRIKMCIRVGHSDFMTIHHELGHTYYQLAYSPLPVYYRDAATPAFHEAIGDAITLSVSTPKHLKKIGLLDDYDVGNDNGTINYLLSSALSDVTFLPFGFLVDKWRNGVYKGETTSSTYNQDWWKLRCDYQGVQPPNLRTEKDFDPGAKYHIADGVGYIRYFLSHFLQFELYKAMCEVSGHTGPLHTCDFDGSKKAGALLSKVLKLGSSKNWREVIHMINGKNTQTADAMMEYYAPLLAWLKKENQGHEVEWGEGCPPGTVSKSSMNRGNVIYPLVAFILCQIIGRIRA